MIKLFLEGTRYAIETDATEEYQFLFEFGEMIAAMIAGGRYMLAAKNDRALDVPYINENVRRDPFSLFANGWDEPMAEMLSPVVDICLRLRAQNKDQGGDPVTEYRVLAAGPPTYDSRRPFFEI